MEITNLKIAKVEAQPFGNTFDVQWGVETGSDLSYEVFLQGNKVKNPPQDELLKMTEDIYGKAGYYEFKVSPHPLLCLLGVIHFIVLV